MLRIVCILALSAITPVQAQQTCRSATTAEFKALPGASRYIDLVKADFGNRAPTEINVNAGPNTRLPQTVRPEGTSTDRRGMLCMSAGPFQAAPASAGDMVCSSQISEFGGDYSGGEGGSGSITAVLQSGVNVAAQWSTTASTSVGMGMSTTITASFPMAVDIGGSVSSTFDVTNQQSASTTSTVNQAQTFTVMADVPLGAICKMLVNVTSCTINTSLQVPITFSGFVNNHFDRQVTYTGQGTNDKHQDWWIKPSIYSMSEAEMSSYMTVSGSLQSTSYGDAYVSCTGTNGTSNILVSTDSVDTSTTITVVGSI